MATTSGVLGGYIYSYQSNPTLNIYEWDIAEPTSPAGYRSVVSGVASFVKQLGVTDATVMEFEDTVLDFSSLQAEYAAKVQCFTFINTNNRYHLSNMKVWMPSGTALDSGGNLEFATSGSWQYNATLPSGAGTAMPTALPASQNVYRQDGDRQMWLATDTHSSQFIYLGLTVPSGLPLGRYGQSGSGNLVFRITFDWYDIITPVYSLVGSTLGRYPRLYGYPDTTALGMTSGLHLNANDVKMRAPYAKNGEMLFMALALAGYNMGAVTEPSEWTQIYEAGSFADINAYYKTYDDADASGQLYTWNVPFTNGNDLVAHVVRLINCGTPIMSGFDYQSSSDTQTALANMTVAQKSLVLYYFTTTGASAEFRELPSDVIVVASGLGVNDGVYANTPTWVIGYKNFGQAGVDGGGTFHATTNGGCLRVVFPFSAQHYLPPQTVEPIIS